MRIIDSPLARLIGACAVVLATLVPTDGVVAQRIESPAVSVLDARAPSLDSIVAVAAAANPRLRAARERVRAAEARATVAGTRPDPMLMAGVQNVPVSDPGFGDLMTMKMVGVGQVIPYPGKIALRTRAAAHEVRAAEADLTAARLGVEAEVKRSYYDLVFVDRALEIVERNRLLLLDLVRVTEARYSVGSGGQEDVLRVRVEIARLGEEAVALLEQRRGDLARLNALLDRPSETPVSAPEIPRRVARAAVADSVGTIRFQSAALGARAADSPLPAVDALQAMLRERNPELRAHGARLEALASRADLAQREHLPDIDVAFTYGQREGRSDMFSAQMAIPIPLQRGRKQAQQLGEARAEVAAAEAERDDRENALRADVARLHAELERDRAQLALSVKAILPQGRAALAAATANYQVGRADFLSLLDTQATLFTYEMNYFRVLCDFAKTLAELERVAGEEIVR